MTSFVLWKQQKAELVQKASLEARFVTTAYKQTGYNLDN